MKRYFYTSVVLISALPLTAFAQGNSDFTYDRVVNILYGFVNFLMNIAMVIAVIAIIWYAIQMMTSGGNPTKYQEAKQSVIWAVIGVAVIFAINTLLATIQGVVTRGSLS